MKTSLEYKKLFKTGVHFIAKYRVYITIVVLACIFGFAVLRINQLSDPKTDEELVIETLKTYKEVFIDEETVESIRALTESDVQVKPQFNNRNNPFAE